MGNLLNLREPNDKSTKLNVLGQPIEECSCDPMTGWKRDGSCATDENDQGQHTICCVMTDDFLKFSKDQGNDLSTPHPEFGFPGLRAGDHWCLCAERWKEAFDQEAAPGVSLKACHQSALSVIPLNILRQYDVDANSLH
ncbi:DUF2237 domain-containing protein [Bacteriovoracaceae bacterium]|nr:DUF2237 domain-containing protein [Bacteriovoracaceae bacterium]